jgi:small multidrug resistance family-3 protein
MTKAIALINDFLMLAIASSFLCWIASLHPQALVLVRAVYVVFALLWMLSWMLDDWLVLRLRVDILTLQGVLVSGLAASVLGLGVMLCRF